MATAAEVASVRKNTNEADETLFTDVELDAMIDELGVDATSAAVWRVKASVYADLVNTSEAGASHSYSDLHKNALAMAAMWEAHGGGTGGIDPAGSRPKVTQIVRQ